MAPPRAYLRLRERSSGVGANVTPMIDVVFLLIIFFLVVAQFSRQQIVEVELPGYDPTAATVIVRDGLLALNVVPAASRDAGIVYSLGGLGFGPSEREAARIVDAIAAAIAAEPAVEIVVRADRAEQYELVHAAMQAARDAGADRVHLATLVGDGAAP